jgi:PAS domain S-box-containing protein
MSSPVPSRGRRALWLVCALLVMATLITGAVVIWQLHQSALASSKREMNNLGIVLAEQTSRTVQSVDLMLRNVQARAATSGVEQPEQFHSQLTGASIREFLSDQLRNLPQAETIALIAADGMLVNWSRNEPVPMVDFSDREYFRQMSANDETGAFISAPGDGPATGKWLMFMARRVNGANGVFVGLVVALIDTQYLEDFYRTINMAPGESVTLLRRDGIVIAGVPDISVGRGRRVPLGSPWFGRVGAGGGSYRSPDFLGIAPATITVHPVQDYPLVVDVNVSEYAALRNWRNEAVGVGAATLAVAAGLTVLFGMIATQFGRQEEQNVRLNEGAEALRASERNLKAYAAMSVDWFWEQDADLHFVRSADIPLTSLPSDVGQSRWDFADPAMDQRRWDTHKADLAARRPFRDFRWERIQIDGKRRFMSTSGDPIFDEAGTFTGYHGTGRDIGTQVAAEIELREAKENADQTRALLRDAVDSMSEAFVIYDNEDRFVMCNGAYREIYAEGGEQFLPGARHEDILRLMAANGAAPPGNEAAWVEEWLRNHRQATGAVEQLMPNGQCLLVTNRRMKNGGIAGLRIDITALKQAQVALLESKASLDRAQSIAGIGSWELDIPTGRAIWSKELYRIRGVSPENFDPNAGDRVVFVHPEDLPAALEWIAGLTAGIEQHTRETRNVRPDGEVRLLRVEGRAIAGPDGVVRRLEGTMEDITDRRLIERQLEQSQKMEAIGNLTGGMAHDFNNGLGIIIGNLDLLGRLIKSDVSASELCDDAREGALRCADLIRMLLAFARRQPLDIKQLDVNALVEGIAKLLSRTLGEDITLTTKLGMAMPPVDADPAQLEAALTNLANNARDAMPRGGRLSITTKTAELDAQYTALHPEARAGQYVLIEIADSGSGIAPEIIGSIFEPFFTTKEPGRGTGLGLSMVFGFVKQSGGHLSVYSEPGLGTTFRIYLPPARTGGPTADLISADHRPVVGGDEVLLVVEDNAPLRRAATRQLVDLGYQVREAGHAAEALAILAEGNPVDLLFTDVVMPGTMDGVDLAYEAARLRPGLKVLLTSGFSGVRGGDERVEHCPYQLLNKPYGHDELARSLRETLDSGPTGPNSAGRPRMNLPDGEPPVTTRGA